MNIIPDDGKGKLFQSLSDIFSKNLILPNQKSIDSALKSANALKNTLSQGGIETKDYFDIALYSFLIFQQISWDEAKQTNTLERSLVEGNAIYELYNTIFQATQRYADSIVNNVNSANTQRSLATAFYEPMLRILLDSIYSTYTTVEQGNIVLSQAFLDTTGEAQLSSYNHKEILKNLNDTYTTVKRVFDQKLQPVYQ